MSKENPVTVRVIRKNYSKKVKFGSLNLTNDKDESVIDLWNLHYKKPIQIFIQIEDLKVHDISQNQIKLKIQYKSVKEDIDRLEHELIDFIKPYIKKLIVDPKLIVQFTSLVDSENKLLTLSTENKDYGPIYFVDKNPGTLNDLEDNMDCDVILELVEVRFNKKSNDIYPIYKLRQLKSEKLPPRFALSEYSFIDEEDSDTASIIDLDKDDGDVVDLDGDSGNSGDSENLESNGDNDDDEDKEEEKEEKEDDNKNNKNKESVNDKKSNNDSEDNVNEEDNDDSDSDSDSSSVTSEELESLDDSDDDSD